MGGGEGNTLVVGIRGEGPGKASEGWSKSPCPDKCILQAASCWEGPEEERVLGHAEKLGGLRDEASEIR